MMTWQVLHARDPSHAPSSSMSLRCATSSMDIPTGACRKESLSVPLLEQQKFISMLVLRILCLFIFLGQTKEEKFWFLLATPRSCRDHACAVCSPSSQGAHGDSLFVRAVI